MILSDKQSKIMELILDMVDGEHMMLDDELSQIGELTPQMTATLQERMDNIRLIEGNASLIAELLAPNPVPEANGETVVSLAEYRVKRFDKF